MTRPKYIIRSAFSVCISGLICLGRGCDTRSSSVSPPPFTAVKIAPANVSSKAKVGVSRMQKDQLIRVAKQAVIKKGYRLKDYLELTATFDPKEKEWIVVLDHKPPHYPGSRSLVFVNDQNGKVTLLPGL